MKSLKSLSRVSGHAAARQIGAGAIQCGPDSSAERQDTPSLGRKMAYQQLKKQHEPEPDQDAQEGVGQRLGRLVGRIDQPSYFGKDLDVLVVIGSL